VGPGQTITVPLAEGGVNTTFVILPGETSAVVNGVTVSLLNTPGAIASAIASVLGLSKSTGVGQSATTTCGNGSPANYGGNSTGYGGPTYTGFASFQRHDLWFSGCFVPLLVLGMIVL
jgi:hypothetical protein